MSARHPALTATSRELVFPFRPFRPDDTPPSPGASGAIAIGALSPQGPASTKNDEGGTEGEHDTSDERHNPNKRVDRGASCWPMPVRMNAPRRTLLPASIIRPLLFLYINLLRHYGSNDQQTTG